MTIKSFSKHIENRVNNMISSADEKDEAGHVFIRVVFVGDKAVETRPGVRKEGTNVGNQVAEKYKYRAKGKKTQFRSKYFFQLRKLRYRFEIKKKYLDFGMNFNGTQKEDL